MAVFAITKQVSSTGRMSGMLRRSVVTVFSLAVFTVFFASIAAAQETVKGRTFLSLGGGLTFGPGELWSIRRQPLLNPNLRPAPGDPPFVDSLFLSQSVDAGSSFLVSVTTYPSNRIGIGTDVAYHGFRSSQDCAVVFDTALDDRLGNRDPDGISSPNRSACFDVRARSRDAITLDLIPFVAWRVLPSTDITPVLKMGAGISLSPCTVRINSTLRNLINGDCTGSTRPVFGASMGFYRQTDIETQFHFEFKYSVHRWGVVDGAADLDGIVTTSSTWRGGFGFSMGVDFQV